MWWGPGFCHCSSPDASEAQEAVGTGLSWEPRTARGAGSRTTVVLRPSSLPGGCVGHGGVIRSSQPLTSHSHLPKGKHCQLPGQGRNQAGEELQQHQPTVPSCSSSELPLQCLSSSRGVASRP